MITLIRGLTPLTARDRRNLAELGAVRAEGLRAATGAVCRCGHGLPVVLLCDPILKGRPFPTTFWLVCPALSRAAGAAENAGGVAALQAEMASRAGELLEYHKLHAAIRLSALGPARRRYLAERRPALYRPLRRGGAGGIAYGQGHTAAKCLHLHTASLLALGRHPAAALLRASVLERAECAGSCI